MANITAFIESGILEPYVLGTASAAEMIEVETMMKLHPEVRAEVDALSFAVERFAQAYAVEPGVTIKPFLMATLDYTNRIEMGEEPSFPPELNEHATIAQYAQWLNRPDMVIASDFKDSYAKIIGFTTTATTAIVWLSDMAPQEVHTNEFEKFLIVEGSCDITIGDTIHHLSVGSYMAIPLHAPHSIKVTSSNVCKVILQRIAA